MKDFLVQIEGGLKQNLYYLSLFSALTIPDICGAMESENGIATGEKYKNWFNKYVAKRDPDKYGDGKNLTADICWNYRCALLHQGHSQHKNINYRRILFIEPPLPTCNIHSCVISTSTTDKSLLIDVQKFCGDIIQGAYEWLAENEDSANYKNNYQNFIKRYPNGVKPIFGCAIIG